MFFAANHVEILVSMANEVWGKAQTGPSKDIKRGHEYEFEPDVSSENWGLF